MKRREALGAGVLLVTGLLACKERGNTTECPLCAGKGRVINDTPVQGKLGTCETGSTGFLGLGSDREATIEVINEDEESGEFTAQLRAGAPAVDGALLGAQDVSVPAGQRRTVKIRYAPPSGGGAVTCGLKRPDRKNKKIVICQRCGGEGRIPKS